MDALSDMTRGINHFQKSHDLEKVLYIMDCIYEVLFMLIKMEMITIPVICEHVQAFLFLSL